MVQSEKKPKPSDYERLGRLMEDAYEAEYVDTRRLFKVNFLKGIASGLGGIVGATIGVAVLLFILARLNTVPLVGPFFHNVEKTIQRGRTGQ